MSIGSNIKRLRREKDITQEQLAEYLGITSRAISQWECDRTAPDISLLPALCHIFDVSSDTLLGIDIEKNNEEIKKYLEKAHNEEADGNFEKSVETLREAIRKFPKSYPIMQRLANMIVCVHSRKGIKDYKEVFELCNRVLAECTDSTTRYEAIDTLGTAYGYAGKREEMLKLAEEMPHVYFSREDFMRYRWRGDADFEKFQDYMHYLIGRIVEMVRLAPGQRHDNNEFIYPIEDRIHLWKTAVALLELLFPDGDYQFMAQFGEQACHFLCTAYIRKQEYEEAWHWMEKAADFAIHMDTYDFDALHTSPVLRGFSSGGWIMEAEGNRSQSMIEWLTTDEKAAVLRSDARYEGLINRLKAVAKKP